MSSVDLPKFGSLMEISAIGGAGGDGGNDGGTPAPEEDYAFQ